MAKFFLNDDWDYAPDYTDDMISSAYTGSFQKVRLPHTVAETPFNAFPTSLYQKKVIYRRSITTESSWQGKCILLNIEGAAHKSDVYLNGTHLYTHACGYTAFTVDITQHLAPAGSPNLLVIVVDSHESLNQPPFGFVIDYMTYGGLYREVSLEVRPQMHIKDVFVHTQGTRLTADVTLHAHDEKPASGLYIHQKVLPLPDSTSGSAPSTIPLADFSEPVSSCKQQGTPLTATGTCDVPEAAFWSLTHPVLYTLVSSLTDSNGTVIDEVSTRFGFRDIRFDESGFYLNGEKIKLRGLNRHQSWPYVGYAMPRSMQREDADILKYELGLNEVRTSHYPQSQHFIDRCDEIGLLVFTELPGWQHIGDSAWKEQAVQNVRDMVLQYRNHPSIFLWGVRINESMDDDELYTRTNAAARELDPTRPTGGVRFLQKSHLLEDVYTFNDFSCYGPNAGCLPKKKVTATKKGYLISEYNGHMYPTKSFDCESHRTEHALRHAKVLDAVYSREEIAGASGWCMTDYNTHKDFGSGDYICYHGVMDMFRNPKTAAAVYRSQEEASVVGDVLVLTSSMDIGEHPGGARGDVYIITNADSVKMYVNGIFIKEYTASDSPYKHLRHGPILIDDYIGHRLVDEDGISEKYSAPMKAMLFALQKYGVDRLPLRFICKGLHLWLKGVTNPNKLRTLYGKYIGNWGGESVKYTFESYREGKRVQTVVKTAAQNVHVQAHARRLTLTEDATYDTASVQILALDEYGNVQPYCQEAVTLRTEGAILLTGPKAVSLKGGMAGCYVRSDGKSGTGTLVITDWQGNEQRLSFDVTVTKKSR
ncbi:MAG: glycoside hydrolase family 2 protein [Treponema sp.]|nr:glycoside hydrolase family 2 protein [Treponema sp.]